MEAKWKRETIATECLMYIKLEVAKIVVEMVRKYSLHLMCSNKTYVHSFPTYPSDITGGHIVLILHGNNLHYYCF